MPIDNRMHAHKRRPPPIRRVKVRQLRAVRVRAPRADKDGAHARVLREVGGKGGLHGRGAAREGEAVGARGAADEGLDFGEGV